LEQGHDRNLPYVHLALVVCCACNYPSDLRLELERLDTKSDSGNATRPPRVSFRWQNFRSFEDTGWVEVRPITVFIGANSSGKTTLFLPLLLLKQTWTSRDHNLALKTTGPIVHLGNYRELVFRHREGETLSFSLRFVDASTDSSKEDARRIGSPEPSLVRLEFCRGDETYDIKLKKFEVRDRNDQVLVARSLTQSGSYTLRTARNLSKQFQEIMASEKPRHFLFLPHEQILQAMLTKAKKARKAKPLTLQIRISPATKTSTRTKDDEYLELMSIAGAEIRSLLQSVTYLGPVRDYPQRFYHGSDEVPESVGSRGEKTAEILLLRKDQQFRKGLTQWLTRFGLAARIRCEPLGRGLFAVRIAGAARKPEFDYADAGFGLSQLLPLIVQCLHATNDTILCIEQPEIHLNPKLQSILANLFAAVARDKKFLIVETHSEHFLLRLRTLIAERVLRPEDVALYYLEKESGKSKQRRIDIATDGHIEHDEWPQGFFEDSVSESFRLASLQKL
jgi:predicted ATPase